MGMETVVFRVALRRIEVGVDGLVYRRWPFRARAVNWAEVHRTRLETRWAKAWWSLEPGNLHLVVEAADGRTIRIGLGGLGAGRIKRLVGLVSDRTERYVDVEGFPPPADPPPGPA